MKSAFWAASQPGYSRNEAVSVIQTAATAETPPSTNTANSSRRVSDARRGRPFSASGRPRGPSSCASEVVPLVIGPEEAIVG